MRQERPKIGEDADLSAGGIKELQRVSHSADFISKLIVAGKVGVLDLNGETGRDVKFDQGDQCTARGEDRAVYRENRIGNNRNVTRSRLDVQSDACDSFGVVDEQ